MFPMEFDRRVLDGLPLPDAEAVRRTVRVLQSLVHRRVLPQFKMHRGTDSIQLGAIGDRLGIERLEDPAGVINLIALVEPSPERPLVFIHERFFDLLAFVIPSDPEARLGASTANERQVLAFAELVLRHLLEHILYPEQTAAAVVQADADFARDRSIADPTFYRDLLQALGDELNGLKGAAYAALLEAAASGQATDKRVQKVLTGLVPSLSLLPEPWSGPILTWLDLDVQARILGECYKRSRSTSYSLVERANELRKLMVLFAGRIDRDQDQARELFRRFVERWGLVALFHELDLESDSLDSAAGDLLFDRFREGLDRFMREVEPSARSAASGLRDPAALAPTRSEQPEATKSLKDRIEEARNNPRFPAPVMEVIDKNKLNAVGHSGSKYSEMIETLLAIPWGRSEPIQVSPQEFEQGLNRSHYGLDKPKEIVSDFFINLIWRCRQLPDLAQPQARLGSAYLFVGPPGVGKTSLAISIARNLGTPYHKLSLGGMRDEADLRGHGFTYEGSKPGAIVQGLIKMGVMNGMFILDEADKTEKFAIATLLEVLDPEQNHLFHDKYTQTTVDIDLSNCHFILTANTLEPVPAAVVNRCEVVVLDRYSIDEKVAIAERHLIQRVRNRYRISDREVAFDPRQQTDLLRYLVKTYTREAGVRELERVIRTLFLRLLRKEILGQGQSSVLITRAKIKQYLEPPAPSRRINPDDRIGEMLGLGVDPERGIGSIIPIQATRIGTDGEAGGRPQAFLSMVHATGNLERVMDESRKVATTAILYCAEELGIDTAHCDLPIHLHFMGGSSRKDGPSAGGAIALALASVLSGTLLRRDLAMTGEIDTHGRITAVGGLDIKLETAYDAGCKTFVIPMENLTGDDGIERFSAALKEELQILTFADWREGRSVFDYRKQVLQVVAVENIVQAAAVAFITRQELDQAGACLLAQAPADAAAIAAAATQRTDAAVIYVKDPCELNFPALTHSYSGRLFRLLAPEAGDPAGTLEDDPGCRALLKFRPGQDRLLDMVRRIGSELRQDGLEPGRLALIAPFYFLKEQLQPGEWRAESGSVFPEIRLFANNFTLQGFKIKACKASLNQAFLTLSRLQPDALASHPFVATLDGIHCLDVGCLPEKLRLDQQRAEQLINTCLANWQRAVFGAPDPPPDRSS